MFNIYLFGNALILLFLYWLINKSSIDNKFKLNFKANNDDIYLLGLYIFESNDNIVLIYSGFKENIFRMFILSNFDNLMLFN